MSEWTINRYLKACWHWAWMIVLLTLTATGLSFAVSRSMPPTYRATATIMTGEESTNPQVKVDDWVLAQRLVTGYGALVKRQPILEAAVKSLGLKTDWRQVQENVLAAPVQGTALLEIRVTDSDPQRAATLANEIVRQLILQSPTLSNEQQLESRRAFTQQQLNALESNIKSSETAIQERQSALETETSARTVMALKDEIKGLQTKVADWRSEYAKLLADLPTKSPNTITLVEAASPPLRPASPNLLFNVLLAGFAGLLLSVGSAVLIEYLRAGRINTVADGAKAMGVPGLGAVAEVTNPTRSHPVALALANPHCPMAEAFRMIRTNVRFAWAGPEPMVLVVTSAGVGEGKSTISANLAASFAQAGKQTIIIDADLRHPSLQALFATEATDGLDSLLRNRALHVARDGTELPPEAVRSLSKLLDEVLVETPIPNLRLLPAGSISDTNPGELLMSPTMGVLIHLLCRMSDVVILDSPPVLPIADTVILSTLPTSVVLVAEANRTSVKNASLAVETLNRAQARILGFVLNKAAQGPASYYEYHASSQQPVRPRRHSFRLLGGS